MQAGSYGLAFFDKSYDEALALTQESYGVLSRIEQNEFRVASPVDDLRVRGEAFRLTTRLMQVVAWLLTQRAVHAGELSAEEVSSNAQYRLGAAKVCRDDSQHHHPTIPDELADLLDRSLNLYVRIARLDELLHSSVH